MPEGSEFEVKVLRTLEEVEQLRGAWHSMQWNPESDIDFVSFIVKVRPEIIRPHVIVVYRNGQPVTLLAARLEQGHLDIKIGYKVICRIKIRQIGTFYGGFMGQTTSEIAEIVVRHLVRSLREENADILMWSGVRCRSELHDLLNRLPGLMCRDYLARAAGHWSMSLPLSLEEILKGKMSKHFRAFARRIVRHLERDFPDTLRYICFSKPEGVEQLYKDVLQVAKKTYQWGLGVGFRDTEEQMQRLRLEAEKGWLRGHVLYIKGQPVGFWICTVYQDAGYSVSTGYDPAFAKYNVGTAMFLHLIDEMCREKVKRFDFGIGSSFYKERFGEAVTQEAILSVFAFNIRGISLNALRVFTGLPVLLGRNILQHLGLEQKIKTLWRNNLTHRRLDSKLTEPSPQENS